MLNIYDGRGWVLGICKTCGRLNYVEPHGTTASCKICHAYTEHVNVPYELRNAAGTVTHLDNRAETRKAILQHIAQK